jgi:GNAT superfamily N-acetyltransferase
MDMTFTTWQHWTEKLWQRMRPIYEEAFPHGAKPESLLRRMVERETAVLHEGTLGTVTAAMAVSGVVGPADNRKLIVDYMAVQHELRGHGLGHQFLRQIRDWAVSAYDVKAIIIEAEAEDNEANNARLAFWVHCGFIPTSYVHTYIWVPEPYRALVLPLTPGFELEDDGQSLFRSIIAFHEKAYRKR